MNIICPRCGSSVAVIPMLYGLPTMEALKAAEDGLLALGGCDVSDRDPEWFCVTCKCEFGPVDWSSHSPEYQEHVRALLPEHHASYSLPWTPPVQPRCKSCGLAIGSTYCAFCRIDSTDPANPVREPGSLSERLLAAEVGTVFEVPNESRRAQAEEFLASRRPAANLRLVVKRPESSTGPRRQK